MFHTSLFEKDAHFAMSLRRRIPFLAPPDLSSAFDVTKSILDMILIHGISKLTMADIADRTPLPMVLVHRFKMKHKESKPKEFIAIFHEL